MDRCDQELTRREVREARDVDTSERLKSLEMKWDLVIPTLATRAQLKEEVGSLRTELKGDIVQVRLELKDEIGKVRTDMNLAINGLRAEVNQVLIGVNNELKGLREGQSRTARWLIGLMLTFCTVGLAIASFSVTRVAPAHLRVALSEPADEVELE
ncbi:hypothetical protein CDN99_00110 [Roseateles aquatilis]|uniref:DUF1640 domain-containing protein n=2 Tax=Roseateles aquatilis TaxID=431061 RepID=A0A246JJX7_9BURK|nr:hypothetical protein CDN99_00110 [Roseateles aquatilis]